MSIADFSSTPKGIDNTIFVHSSFRVSSTWIWSKFRNLTDTISYYEVFNEGLEKFDLKTVSAISGDIWKSNHPIVANYFIEYLPIIKDGGGIEGYEKSMSVDSFIPADGFYGSLSVGEKNYLERLIQHARANRKIPVLTCTRTLGRIEAIKKDFPGRNIFLHRNIFHQWASFSSQKINGNPYFFEKIEEMIKASRHDKFICMIDDWYSSRIPSPHDESFFGIFILFHLYLYANAYDSADLVIDATAMAKDANLRQSVEGYLSEMVGSHVDLSDARSDFEFSLVNVRSHQFFIDTINQFTKIIAGYCRTEKSARFIESMKSDALEEWQRHEFYARKSRSFYTDRILECETLLEQEKAAHASVMAERDQLAERLATAPANGGGSVCAES
ncbi:hypothetical protein ABMY26_31605 [Azospirillum sp. HJ39]|uniref:hypothetical protein n=1 Tax=Azospirillum sp. HJ39 TaxID=3159496 RepID=UPI003557DF8C